MTPIEIAGERIESADWPNRWRALATDSAYANGEGAYRILEHIPAQQQLAAILRCHFLDKAEDSRRRFVATKNSDVSILDERHAYLASAAKWARIGRAK